MVSDWREDSIGDDVGDLDDDLDLDLLDEAVPARWVNMATVLGASLIVVIALQLLFSLVEGFSYKAGEPEDIATDLLHRLGFPFANLGTTALLFLVVGLVLLSLPAYFEEATTPSQDRLTRLAVGLACAVAVILALGSLLAVRANFHVYGERDVSVPGYVVVQYVTFLIGNLGTAVAAVYAAVQVMSLRERRPR